MTPAPTIRLLQRQDGSAYQQLRLRSLQNSSPAFLSSFETESALHEDAFANHLDAAFHPPHYGYFGIFVGDQLAGYVQIGKTYLDKQEHIALVNNLYIDTPFRRQGLAEELFSYIFQVMEGSEKIERLFLTCAAKNSAAQHLYKKLGFRRYAVKVKSIKWHDTYDDEIEMVKVFNSGKISPLNTGL